jgi:hypothetical protein
MYVCLSNRKYQRGSHRTDLREICLGVLMKKYRENQNLLKSDKKALYMKGKVCFIVAGNITWPLKGYVRMKLHQALRMAEEA